MAAILERQTAKKMKQLHKKDHSDIKLVLFNSVIKPTMTGLFSSIFFEPTQCKTHSVTNLVKIYSIAIEILFFSCFVIILVMTDGDHLAMPSCQKT